jgi:molybdopterin converting factor small subunit
MRCMQIRVEYTAQMKRAAGTGSEQFDVPEHASLADLMTAIARRHGDGLKGLLFDSTGALRKSILVFVGDVQIVSDSKRELSDQDTVTIVPPISGG